MARSDEERKHANLRFALQVIDGFLVDPEIGKGLAHVLSAMRGPDVPTVAGQELKSRTTAAIRAKAFPKGAAKFGEVSARKVVALKCIKDTEAAGFHFINHIRNAAEALGLIVVNE